MPPPMPSVDESSFDEPFDDTDEAPKYRSLSGNRGKAKLAQAQRGNLVRIAPPVPSSFEAATDAGVATVVHSHAAIVPFGSALDVGAIDNIIDLMLKEITLVGGLVRRSDIKMFQAGATSNGLSEHGKEGIAATLAAPPSAVGMQL
jgi:hypothetical protein